MADERLTYWNCKEKGSALPIAINDGGDSVSLEDICAKLAAYEDKAEQGLLVELPWEVGTKVYILPNYPAYWDEIEETEITGIAVYLHNPHAEITTSMCLCFNETHIGKTVFLTKEEAENELLKKGEINNA